MVRPIETYRAARQVQADKDKGIGAYVKPDPKYTRKMNVIRRSFVSKSQGKYMPHNMGGGFYPTPDRTRAYADVRKVLDSWMMLRSERKKTMRNKWKRLRRSGLN